MEKKEKSKILVIIAIIVILVLGVICFTYLTKNKTTTNETKETQENEQYTTQLKDIAKTGDYIQYEIPYEKFTMTNDITGEPEKGFETTTNKVDWKVLYNDSDYGLQIISSQGVSGTFSLSGKIGYNNAVDALNEFCNHFVNKDFALSGRSVGSNPKTPQDTSSTEEHFSLGTVKVADENYKIDFETISKNDTLQNPGQTTFLASRYKGEKDNLNRYCLRSIDYNGNLNNDSCVLSFSAINQETETGVQQYFNTNTNTGLSIVGATRAVITLKNDIKIKGGDGTKDNPYILVN